jgi:hypothetical protein
MGMSDNQTRYNWIGSNYTKCVSAICLCTTFIRELHHHKIKGSQLSVDSQNTHQLNRNCFLNSQKASKWELCVTAFDTSGKESASFEEKPSTPNLHYGRAKYYESYARLHAHYLLCHLSMECWE